MEEKCILDPQRDCIGKAEAARLEGRIAAMETGKAEQTDVDELHEALNMILTGYTGEEAADEAGTA